VQGTPVSSITEEPSPGGLVAPAQEDVATPQQNGFRSRPSKQRSTPTDLGSLSRNDYFEAEDTFTAGSATPPAPSAPEPDVPAPQSDPPPAPLPRVPANVKRYSLVDKPQPAPPVVVEEPPSPRETPPPLENSPIDSLQAPAIANSLAALKKSDTLERRASKRFSTYNISKITGASTRERPTRTGSNRRSLAVSNALTQGELAVLTEVEEPEPTLGRDLVSSPSRRTPSRSITPDRVATPPRAPLPPVPSKTPEPVSRAKEPSVSQEEQPAGDAELSPPPSGSSFSVFLQLGREVKKVTIEPGLSLSSLRMLFVDKFSYTPGLENFPAIYIRDPSSGVQYELEDVDEVKEKCLLSLNIERM
jgi:hypothetical protein